MLSIQKLNKQHFKQGFDCGIASLNEYIQHYARQDQTRRAAAVYVWAGPNNLIHGYYTLSSFSVRTSDIQTVYQSRLSNYRYQPATLLGRLAVDSQHQGQGSGKKLLLDALNRAHTASLEVSSVAVVVDSINDSARKFYSKFGFAPIPDSNRLLIPMKTIAQLFS